MRLRTHTSQSWWRRNAPGRKAAICSTRGAQSNEAASRTGGGYFTISNSELFNCAWPADGGDAAPGSTSDLAMLSMVQRAMATPQGTERAVFQSAAGPRSEEHTTAPQSPMRTSYAVLCFKAKAARMTALTT